MKVAIVGSRHLARFSLIEAALSKAKIAAESISLVVTGGASGIDTSADLWARGKGIPVRVFRVESAGAGSFAEAARARNQQIAECADVCVAIPAPDSKGTWDTVRRFKRLKKRVVVFG